MRKLLLSTVLTVISVFSFVANASAQNYKGTLSNVTMNGKHFNDVPNQIFVLTDNGNGTFQLTGEVKQIGKMPGTINVDVQVLVTNDIISPKKIGDKAGVLNLFNGGLPVTIKLGNITGSRVGNTLHFVLDTYAGWQAIPTFPASVTFDGSF